MKNKSKFIISSLAIGSLLASTLYVPLASAESESMNQNQNWSKGMGMRGEDGREQKKNNGRGMPMRQPGVFGTVTAVSGNTISVLGRVFQNGTSTNITYTVDATNAKIIKNNATSSISSVLVNDTVRVQGTVSGTSVVATVVHDGAIMNGRMGDAGRKNNGGDAIVGDGNPIVGGKVTALSGNSITIKNVSNITYTVNATNAKIVKQGATSTISNIIVGDNLMVQGPVNGSSITATLIRDQGVDQNNNLTENKDGKENKKVSIGFWGGFRGFFKNIFGF
jgi:hypothetical protein